jgi:hypothetical protein
MSVLAEEAGFGSRHSFFESTVIARELGGRAGRPQVATTIFSAHAPDRDGRSVYVETFIPCGAGRIEEAWIAEEVGTHVGLTLADQAGLPAVREAFLAEGFRIPPFMRDQAIANDGKGVTVVYFEKTRPGGIPRIEILAWGGPPG